MEKFRSRFACKFAVVVEMVRPSSFIIHTYNTWPKYVQYRLKLGSAQQILAGLSIFLAVGFFFARIAEPGSDDEDGYLHCKYIIFCTF